MIRTYVAYSKPTRPTGRTIAKELGASNWGIRDPGQDIDVLVRWGSSRPMPPVSGCEINSVAAIRLAADKIASFEAFAAADVPTIPWHTNAKYLIEEWGTSQVFMARRNFKTKGHGIIPFSPNAGYGLPTEIPEADFYSVYLTPQIEYRLHIADGRVIRTQGKYLDDIVAAQTNPYVRNYETGYRYRAPKEKLNRDRIQSALRAVECLGLDFGAVDLMIDTNRKCHIFEVNTGPACSPLTARCYVANIAAMVRDRTDGRVKLAPGIWNVPGGVDDLEDETMEETYIDERDSDHNTWNLR